MYIEGKEVRQAYISKINSNFEKQIILSNIDPKQRKRRLALSCDKKLSALLREITSKPIGDFYCLNYLHSFRRENKPKSHKIM